MPFAHRAQAEHEPYFLPYLLPYLLTYLLTYLPTSFLTYLPYLTYDLVLSHLLTHRAQAEHERGLPLEADHAHRPLEAAW